MTTLTIKIKNADQKKLIDFVAELGGEIVVNAANIRSGKVTKKEHILNNLESSIEFVKLHQAGKVKTKSIEQLLSEL